MAIVVNSFNYVTWWSVKLRFYHLVSFTHFKFCPKNKDHMTYNGKVICAFFVFPHKPRFQTETWISAIYINAYLETLDLNLGRYRGSNFQNPPFFLHFLTDTSFVKFFYILGLQWRHQKFELTTFWTKFLRNVNNPILNALCKFQVDIPIMHELWLIKV